MSVDTYLRGKNTRGYHRISQDGVEVLIAPTLAGMSEVIDLKLRRFLTFKFLSVEVAVKGHQHSLA